MGNFSNWLSHAWNVFANKDPTKNYSYTPYYSGVSSSIRPDRIRLSRGNERSIVTAVFNRIALDVASLNIEHVRLDDENQFKERMVSPLNECLTLSPNLDQTPREFIHDIVLSMFDEGCVAVVPIDTDIDPSKTNAIDIYSMRVGKIIEWRPRFVKVRLYNEGRGQHEDVIVPKKTTAIIYNPFYTVTNEPNSTYQRLNRKLNILDVIDQQSGAGKLDLIIQLPYVVKSEARQKQAETRRLAIEEQLANSKFGIAYTDGTEKVTQLNRPVDNNIMNQIEYLTSMLYSQLGVTKEIMDGTADASTMMNYYNRTIEPIVSAIVDEMKRKFLTKTARTQGQSIKFFRDPFKLVPVTDLAEIVDKFTRNEIMTSNEFRRVIGMKPSDDPNADELRNKNLNKSDNDDHFTPVTKSKEDDKEE